MATDAFAQLIVARVEARLARRRRRNDENPGRNESVKALDQGLVFETNGNELFDDARVSAVGARARKDMAPVSVAGAVAPSGVSGVARLDFERERQKREARVAALLGGKADVEGEDAPATLHVDNLSGDNAHHIAETMFKAFGRALRFAVSRDERMQDSIPSTKGSL